MYIEKSFFFYGFTRSEMAVIAMRVKARRSNLNDRMRSARGLEMHKRLLMTQGRARLLRRREVHPPPRNDH
jgi:hypothetical protein